MWISGKGDPAQSKLSLIHIYNTEALTKGIGSGPFKLKEINAGESIVYEKYDDYYREPASLDEVVIKVMPDESAQEAALQSGEISMMRITSQTKLEKYQSDDEYTVYNIPEGRLNYMAYNYQSPNMKDINARKAIALALNNEEIVQGAYGSEDLAIPATNFCSPENLYYNDEMKGCLLYTSSTGYNSDVRISYYLLEKPRQCCTPGCRNRAPAKIGRDRVGSKKGEG